MSCTDAFLIHAVVKRYGKDFSDSLWPFYAALNSIRLTSFPVNGCSNAAQIQPSNARPAYYPAAAMLGGSRSEVWIDTTSEMSRAFQSVITGHRTEAMTDWYLGEIGMQSDSAYTDLTHPDPRCGRQHVDRVATEVAPRFRSGEESHSLSRGENRPVE